MIAEAYDGAAASYLDAPFTAHPTLGQIWAVAPNRQNDVSSFASARRPGLTGELDPDHASGKYYRSMVGDLALASDTVVGVTGAAPSPAPSPSTAPAASPTRHPAAGHGVEPAVRGARTSSAVVGSVRWTSTAVRLWAMPTTSGRTLVILPPGTRLRVLGQRGRRERTGLAQRVDQAWERLASVVADRRNPCPADQPDPDAGAVCGC